MKIRRIIRIGLLILLSLVAVVAVAAGSEGTDAGAWPQWRGPQGSGVSSDKNLPTHWNASGENVRWVATIPGEAASSPIVSRGRVIVTTAYESPTAAAWQRSIAGAAALLVGLFLVMRGLIRWKRHHEASRPGVLPGMLTTAVFLVFALLVTVKSDRGESVLRFFGSAFAACGLTDVEHLVSMKKGVPASIWLTSGGIALLGLGVAIGCLRTGCVWRVFGAAAAAVAAWELIRLCPLDQWTEETELYERLIFVIPGVLVALWHFLACFRVARARPDRPSSGEAVSREGHSGGRRGRIEIYWTSPGIWSAGGLGRIGSALALVVLAVLVFWPPNLVRAVMGLQRVVICLDQSTGEILWRTPIVISGTERIHSDNTYATPTPATDGERIVVSFGFAVACLDFQGKVLWNVADRGYFVSSRYGASSSPLIVDGLVITLEARENNKTGRPSFLRAYDIQTGQLRWQVSPESLFDSYVTPLVYRAGGKTQLIVPASYTLTSYDAATGAALWTCKLPQQQLVASPTASGALLCIGGGTHGPKIVVVMRLDAENPGGLPRVLWEAKDAVPETGSPVLYQGCLYSLDDRGALACYDAFTGELLWRERLKTGRHLASLLAADSQIYACSVHGETTVLAAGPEFRILAQNDLNGKCLASPAVADGCLFLRVADRLWCIGYRHWNAR